MDDRLEKLGIVSLSPAGQVVYANASFERMLGYDSGGWHGQGGAACFLMQH